MRNQTSLASIFLFLPILIAVSCSQNNAGDQQKLRQAIESFNTAFKQCDISTLEAMITENYTHTNGNSKSIGKSAWLKYLRSRERDIKSGAIDVLNYEMDEMEIKMHHDMAIVTGKIVVESRREDEVQENEYRITNMWVLESGAWKRAGFHDGKIR